MVENADTEKWPGEDNQEEVDFEEEQNYSNEDEECYNESGQ